MYQLFFNDYPLYDPRDDELIIRDPDVHLAVGEAGEVSFTIDADHPYAWALSKLKGVLDLRADGRSIFKGRITKDKRNFYLSREIEAEGLLACLNDSVIPPFNFPGDWDGDPEYEAAASRGNVIAFFLGWLLDQHNRQVGPDQQIELGEVTVADPNNYISRASSDYTSTMETVRSKLEDLLGGYLLVDYSGDTPVLNYYTDLPLVNTQIVEYGENLLDLIDEADATETYTAILPLGKDGLTIADLEDGEISPGYIKAGKIIYSEAAEELYGSRITRVVEWQDVTEAVNLRTKGLATLSESGTRLTQTFTVKAVDLGSVVEETNTDSAIAGEAIAGDAIVGSTGASVLSGGVSRFIVGRYVQIMSTPHGFSALYPLVELEPDILDPGNTSITLGSSAKSASGLARSSQLAAREQLAVQRMVLDQTQAVLAEQQAALASQEDEVPQVVQEQITAAIQTAESIVFTALERYVETSNFEEYQKTVSGEFELLAGEMLLKFAEATDQTRVVDGDLQRTLETLAKYFEFSMDGLTIRAGENTMNLTLDNDLIIFTKNGRQFGWWDGVDFHTGNIVIDVTERAQFGNFAFVPRSNGSLSFLKVGG